MPITVNAGTVEVDVGGLTTLKMRGYAKHTFTPATGEAVIGGRAGSPNFCFEVDCTAAGQVVSYPDFEIDPTTNALSDPKGTSYSLVLFTDDGDYLALVYKNLVIAPTPATQDLSDIVELSDIPPDPVAADAYYTRPQTDILLAAKQDVLTGYALKFDEADNDHVYCGVPFEREKIFGRFLWELWIKPLAGAEYPLAVGPGGSHQILLGLQASGNGFKITGNFQLVAGNQSFSGRDMLYPGEVHYICATWDGANVRTYVDGVLGSLEVAVGVRQSSGDVSEGVLYLGGPQQHSMFNGWIYYCRGIEGFVPLGGSIDYGFTPERPFSPQWLNLGGGGAGPGFGPIRRANFLYDCTKYSTGLLLDESDGFADGDRQVVTNTVVAAAGITGDGNAKCVITARDLIGSPVTRTFPVTSAVHTSAALIAAAARAKVGEVVFSNPIPPFAMTEGSGADVSLRCQDPAENDPTFNITIQNDTCTGITDDLTAVQTTPGRAGRLRKYHGVLEGASFEKSAFEETTTYNGPVTATPAGAILFDAFERINRTTAWGAALSLGTAPTGQVWTSSNIGIIGHTAFTNTDGNTREIAHALVGMVNQDVRATRVIYADGTGWGPIARYTDANNYIFAQMFLGIVSIIEVVAGVPTVLDSDNAGFAGAEMRLVVNGTTVELYLDGALTPTSSGTTSIVAGSRAGFFEQGALTRMDTVQVRAA